MVIGVLIVVVAATTAAAADTAAVDSGDKAATATIAAISMKDIAIIFFRTIVLTCANN
jgi:hypothetical protein